MKGILNRKRFIYQRRSDGGWRVLLRSDYTLLGHVRRGDMVPWVAYGTDGLLVGGGQTRDSAAHVLDLRDATEMSKREAPHA